MRTHLGPINSRQCICYLLAISFVFLCSVSIVMGQITGIGADPHGGGGGLGGPPIGIGPRFPSPFPPSFPRPDNGDRQWPRRPNPVQHDDGFRPNRPVIQPDRPLIVPDVRKPALPQRARIRPIVAQQVPPPVTVTGGIHDFAQYNEMLIGYQVRMLPDLLAFSRQIGLQIKYAVPGSLGIACCTWPQGFDIQRALEQLKTRPDLVRFVEPNIVFDIDIDNSPLGDPFADPLFLPVSFKKGDFYPGENELWGMKLIDVLDAWEKTTSSPVGIAVLDTGVAYGHPDLKDNMLKHRGVNPFDPNDVKNDAIGINICSSDAGIWDPQPILEGKGGGGIHGTHVAGSIGASGKNNKTVGVLWECSILPIQVFRQGSDGKIGTDLLDYVLGIQYVLDVLSDPSNGTKVKIINLSLASIPSAFSEQLEKLTTGTERGSVQDIFDATREAGVLIVCAAGNSGVNLEDQHVFPACLANLRFSDLEKVPQGVSPNDRVYPNILTVAAVDQQGQLGVFSEKESSNYGNKTVQIAAPGVDIYSTIPAQQSVEYLKSSGTSMAAPYVSGAAALIWGLPEYKDCSPAQIKQILLDNAKSTMSLQGQVEKGRILNLSFVSGPATIPPKPSTPKDTETKPKDDDNEGWVDLPNPWDKIPPMSRENMPCECYVSQCCPPPVWCVPRYVPRWRCRPCACYCY